MKVKEIDETLDKVIERTGSAIKQGVRDAQVSTAFSLAVIAKRLGNPEARTTHLGTNKEYGS